MRVGSVVSLASVYDHEMEKYRGVLYKGYISEMFVPYQDMSEEWYYRTFLDAGEFAFGVCAMPLQPSTDCPKNAVFLDGYYTTRDGTPVKTSNVFCIFERYAGDIMWRHSEAALPGDVAVRLHYCNINLKKSIFKYNTYLFCFIYNMHAQEIC